MKSFFTQKIKSCKFGRISERPLKMSPGFLQEAQFMSYIKKKFAPIPLTTLDC